MKKSSLNALAKLAGELEQEARIAASYKKHTQQEVATPSVEELDALWAERKEECKAPTSKDCDRAILKRNGLI